MSLHTPSPGRPHLLTDGRDASSLLTPDVLWLNMDRLTAKGKSHCFITQPEENTNENSGV
jgi:hypothetical protein